MVARFYNTIRRSFSEFLALPFGEVAVFLIGAWIVSMVDASAGAREHWAGWRTFLDAFIGDPAQATRLMSTIATSLVTMSSITFSILLLAVQQSSAALTNQIVDQYMRRRANQAFFGFFVGSSLFALTCLGLTQHAAVPVLATTVCLVLAILCLGLLVVLIYSTLDQTRPSSIIATIHDSTVKARDKQLQHIGRVSSERKALTGGQRISCERYGYVVEIDINGLVALAERRPGRTIVVERPLGAPVYSGQTIARFSDAEPLDNAEIAAVRRAIRVARRRELLSDPMYGVDQLGNIAWTSVSTAKSNPAAGLVAIHALNDLLYRWAHEGALVCPGPEQARVFCRDTLMDHLACAYESLMVVASESLQQQSLAEVCRGVSRSFPALPGEMQEKLVRAVIGSLSALGDHVPTTILENETKRLEIAFREAGRNEAAEEIARAWDALARSRGTLHSRGDRVPKN